MGGLASLGQREERFGFWEHVHGFTMASIGERSRREVAVEAVARGALATTPCLLKEVDLQLCTREDITLAAPFHLTVTRQEHVTALVTWFQVEFGHGWRKEVLDTGPQGPLTSWQQTSLYLRLVPFGCSLHAAHLRDYITAEEGDTISGDMEMRFLGSGRRDTELEVKVLHRGRRGQLRERNVCTFV